ncbi:MAG: Flp pilus assembly protein CpaB [Chloroflexi bacterium]|nr:Flp pilus assembly protein CpaB [Chloroflexota bacterium]
MKRRSALILMVLGVLMAGGASLLVLGISREASQVSKASVPQVYVVMAARELPDQTQIIAEAIAVRPFPAEFAPQGAVASAEQAIGKYTVGPLYKDQIILAGQLASVRRAPTLSDLLRPGKVVIWLPMPDLLSGQIGFRQGDKVDILLTIPGAETGPTTQTTLQNVEVFAFGTELPAEIQPAPAAKPDGAQAAPAQVRASGSRPLGFLVDHQDAIIIKFIKDSGGTIDLALRSSEEERIVRTDPINMEGIQERFRFRVPTTAAVRP